TARGEATERELRARGDDGRRRLGELEQGVRAGAPALDAPATVLLVAGGELEPVPAHRLAERAQPLRAARLRERAGENRDPLVPVLHEVLHEQADPRVVVDRDAPRPGARDEAVEEDARRLRTSGDLVEPLRREAGRRDEEA